MKLNSIRLLVKDFEKTFSFYKDQLGLTCSFGKPDSAYASFLVGREEGISLFRQELMASAIGKPVSSLSSSDNDSSMIILEVESVDTCFEELSGKGVKFLNTPTDRPDWGIRVVHLRDPEGNLIEFFSGLSLDKWDKALLAEVKEYENPTS